jgi:hypothetical protein
MIIPIDQKRVVMTFKTEGQDRSLDLDITQLRTKARLKGID